MHSSPPHAHIKSAGAMQQRKRMQLHRHPPPQRPQRHVSRTHVGLFSCPRSQFAQDANHPFQEGRTAVAVPGAGGAGLHRCPAADRGATAGGSGLPCHPRVAHQPALGGSRWLQRSSGGHCESWGFREQHAALAGSTAPMGRGSAPHAAHARAEGRPAARHVGARRRRQVRGRRFAASAQAQGAGRSDWACLQCIPLLSYLPARQLSRRWTAECSIPCAARQPFPP